MRGTPASTDARITIYGGLLYGGPVFHRNSNHSKGFGTAVVIKCHVFVDYIFSTFLPETT